MTEYNLAVKAVRARKFRWCSQEWAHDRHINAGDLYVRSVIFPGHDAHPGRHHPGPVSHDLCHQCAGQYIETKGLITAYSG